MIVDVHAHLEHKAFQNDLDKVLERAKQNNIVTIINSGTDQKTNELTLDLSKKYSIIKSSLGLYPTEANKTDGEINKAIEFILKNKNKIIAIGEIGLDYLESKEKQNQKNLFLNLISIAEKLKLPVIIHSRKAEKDTLDILQSSKLKKIILHCFSGNKKLIKQALDNNYHFSIPPIIVYSTHFQQLTKESPLSQLLTETDSPFLSPSRNQRNEPSSILKTIEKISEIKKITKEEVENILFMNYQKIFL